MKYNYFISPIQATSDIQKQRQLKKIDLYIKQQKLIQTLSNAQCKSQIYYGNKNHALIDVTLQNIGYDNVYCFPHIDNQLIVITMFGKIEYEIIIFGNQKTIIIDDTKNIISFDEIHDAIHFLEK
jgi:hypothetical protein